MNAGYFAYLQTPQWQILRTKRIAISRHRCEACGCRDFLEVHHLTYKRIFNEKLSDLMTLCGMHHQQAEQLVKRGIVSREGNTDSLRKKTISGLGYQVGNYETAKRKNTPAFEMRERLKADPFIQKVIRSLPRRLAVKAIQRQYLKHKERKKIVANAIMVYDECAKFSKTRPI